MDIDGFPSSQGGRIFSPVPSVPDFNAEKTWLIFRKDGKQEKNSGKRNCGPAGYLPSNMLESKELFSRSFEKVRERPGKSAFFFGFSTHSTIRWQDDLPQVKSFSGVAATYSA